jgi:hypothetical protein
VALRGDDAAAARQSSHEHLQLLLLNLTVYCVRASEGQPVRVRVRCAPAAPAAAAAAAAGAAARDAAACGEHTLCIEVAAAGHVLSAEQAAAAFDPYAQDGGGSGGAGPGQSRLGLHVSRRLAEALGGRLTVRSCAASGTRFTATIPVAVCTCPESSDEEEEEGGGGGAEPECCSAASSPTPNNTPASAAASPAATPPPSRHASDSCLLEAAARELLARNLAAAAAAAAASAAAEEGAAHDRGIGPFFPPGVPMSHSLEQLTRSGQLPAQFNLLLSNSADGFMMGNNERFSFASPGLLRMLMVEEGGQEDMLRCARVHGCA